MSVAIIGDCPQLVPNPIQTVLPVVRLMPNLRRLGIGKTTISAAEQAEIRKLIPDCM